MTKHSAERIFLVALLVASFFARPVGQRDVGTQGFRGYQIQLFEGSAPTPVAGSALLYADSATHTLQVSNNGGNYVTVPSQAYPVGSVFISTVGTDPATLLGYGSWSAIGAGRVLVGLDSGDPAFDTLEETGGAKTVAAAGSNSAPTFTGSALGTHTHAVGTLAAAAPTFTGDALATHTHAVGTLAAAAPTFTGSALATHAHELPLQIVSATSARLLPAATFGTGTSRAAGGAFAPSSNTTSAAVALSQAVSAGTPAGTVSAPSLSGATAATSAGTPAGTVSAPALSGSTAATSGGTPAGTVSAPTFTGSATSVVQPYFVVVMWKRTN